MNHFRDFKPDGPALGRPAPLDGASREGVPNNAEFLGIQVRVSLERASDSDGRCPNASR
jgi:hypothetical protein